MCASMTRTASATWMGVVAARLPGVPSSELGCALPTDEYSSGEAAGEKTEQNDDDTVKSQEVRSVLHTFLLRDASAAGKENALKVIPKSFCQVLLKSFVVLVQ